MSDDCIALLGTSNLMYIVITAAFLTLGDNFWCTGADSELIGTPPPSLPLQFCRPNLYPWAKLI